MLMVLHMPWCRDLGAPRVAMELAERFESRGVSVSRFDIQHAFPPDNLLLNNRIARFFHWTLFAGKAFRFVRKAGEGFDIIVAEHGDLPFTKEQLRFNGLLVARSNGLAHFYRAYEDAYAGQDCRNSRQGSLLGNLLRALARKTDGGLGRINRSFEAADRILLLNLDEQAYVESELGFRGKCLTAPNGLDDDRLEALRNAASEPDIRLQCQEVAFIGYWCPRKGSDELPHLARKLRAVRPDVRFLLLGTGIGEAEIRAAFAPEDQGFIRVVPSFRSEELPGLLANAAVGVLPSHVEGFGLAVLEMLAAGLPTFAYDVPGPRAMLTYCRGDHLVPKGDVSRLAHALECTLRLEHAAYVELQDEARQIAERFRWTEIADRILADLTLAHSQLQTARVAGDRT